MEGKQTETAKSVQSADSKRGRPPGDAPTFPRDTLKRTLSLAKSIDMNNAGRPFDRLTLAGSVNYSPNSSGFRQLIISSGRYGLTEGGYAADKIALTALGSQIVAPTSESQVNQGLRTALLNPPLFRKVLDFYDKKNIPREEILKNALKKEFQVAPEDVDACYEVLMTNMKDYNLIQNIRGNDFLQLDRLSETSVTPVTETATGEGLGTATTSVPMQGPPVETIQREIVKIPRVFISHSKSKNILGQIKQMLDFGKFEYIIAEDKETTAMPLSDKVFDLMLDCNCAIINISADAEKKQGETFEPNENVLAELWGAYLHYKKRVILVIDRRLKDKLPSIMQGLTAIYYDGDELSWSDGMRLQASLSEFRNQL
jgi:predicted nucleotide-binding protein